jgi:opacity protein-like surface antigen
MTMQTRLAQTRLATITATMAACLTIAFVAQAQSRERASSKVEAATYFGVMIAGKEIGSGVNATGAHEQLIANLNHGFAMGVRVGVHNTLIGMEGNVLTTANPARVNNEFGAAFPNHAERPLICSGDALLYPFRKAIKQGRVRPYVTSGIGGLLFTADLDNINDQERHTRAMWNVGGGVKVFVGNDGDLYFDFRFTNHRMLGSRGLGQSDLRSATVGIGYRF